MTALTLIPWHGKGLEWEAAIGAPRCKLGYGSPGLQTRMPGPYTNVGWCVSCVERLLRAENLLHSQQGLDDFHAKCSKSTSWFEQGRIKFSYSNFTFQ